MFIGFTMFKVVGWEWFRLYTLLTFGIMLIGAVLSPVIIAKNIPIVGLVERISVFAYNQWFILIAIKFFLLA